MDSAEFLLGTVTAISSANGIMIKLDGQDSAMSKYYKIMIAGAAPPSVGERVVIMKHSGTYVVMGKIGMPGDIDTAERIADIETEIAEIDTELGNKVDKAGDTMTGNLIMTGGTYVATNSSTQQVGVRPASTIATIGVYLRDKLQTAFGRLGGVFMSDGRVGVQVRAERTVNGTAISNQLALYIDEAGNRTVGFTFAAPWLAALGLGTSGALPITIAQGGSGQTQTTVETTTANVATPGTNVTLSSAYFCRWGKLAMVEVAGQTTASVSTGSILFTIAEGKRPVIISPAQVGLSTLITAVIRQNGEVPLGNANLSSGASFAIRAVYLLP